MQPQPLRFEHFHLIAVGENPCFEFLVWTDSQPDYVLFVVCRFLRGMDGLINHVGEAGIVKLQQHLFWFGMVFRKSHSNDVLEIFIEIYVGIGNERHIGPRELHDTVECLIGDIVAMSTFL